MYFALTGKPPYSSTNNINEIYLKVIKEPLEDLNNLYKWSWIIDRACKKDMKLRFMNCRDFRNALLSVPHNPSNPNSPLVQGKDISHDSLPYENQDEIIEIDHTQWHEEIDENVIRPQIRKKERRPHLLNLKLRKLIKKVVRIINLPQSI